MIGGTLVGLPLAGPAAPEAPALDAALLSLAFAEDFAVIDADGRIVPVGQQGELCTRGYSVMRGYWEDPKRTREAFDDNGWMRTGDLASLDDPPVLHDPDPVGERAHQREIVGDQQDRHRALPLQLGEEFHDLRLHAQVERGLAQGGFAAGQTVG